MARSSTSFGAGNNANPKGRPKLVHEVRQLAQAHVADCIAGLAKIANDPKEPTAARVAAYNAILDRAVGKPTQAIEGTGDAGALVVQLIRFAGSEGR